MHTRPPKANSLLLSLLLILLTLAVFLPILRFDFINFDDGTYIRDNPHLKNGVSMEGIRWAFQADFFKDSPNADYWQPLTFLSRMVDIELFDMRAGGHHAMNLWFHVLNTVLLFAWLRDITRAPWKSFWLAALFAVHPLQVEPVAWITARKDLLNTALSLITLKGYTDYAKHPSGTRYAGTFFMFALSLMAKPMSVTLPLVMFLLDVWPLERLAPFSPAHRGTRRIIYEKIPFLLLSICAGAVAWSGQPQAIKLFIPDFFLPHLPLSYVWYLGKFLWPARLAIRSPQSEITTPAGWVGASIVLLLAITAAVLMLRRRRPYLAVGWLWFLITLAPVVGLTPQNDRFMYMPVIGLGFVFIWGCVSAVIRRDLRTIRAKDLPGEVPVGCEDEEALGIWPPQRTSIGQLGCGRDVCPGSHKLLFKRLLLGQCVA